MATKKPTNAELTAQLEASQKIIDTVREKVLGYDGCYPGKKDFLKECGIDVNGGLPNVVSVTVWFELDQDYNDSANPLLLADAVQDHMDSADFVKGLSSYTNDIQNLTDESDSSNGCVDEWPETWAEL